MHQHGVVCKYSLSIYSSERIDGPELKSPVAFSREPSTVVTYLMQKSWTRKKPGNTRLGLFSKVPKKVSAHAVFEASEMYANFEIPQTIYMTLPEQLSNQNEEINE